MNAAVAIVMLCSILLLGCGQYNVSNDGKRYYNSDLYGLVDTGKRSNNTELTVHEELEILERSFQRCVIDKNGDEYVPIFSDKGDTFIYNVYGKTVVYLVTDEDDWLNIKLFDDKQDRIIQGWILSENLKGLRGFKTNYEINKMKNVEVQEKNKIIIELQEKYKKAIINENNNILIKLYTSPSDASSGSWISGQTVVYIVQDKGEWVNLKYVSERSGLVDEGWLHGESLKGIDGNKLKFETEILPNKLKASEEKKKYEKEKKEKAKRENEVLISKYPQEIQNCIKNKKVCFGMDATAVILSWGKPDHINRTVFPGKRHEQWIYGGTYLYFENDVLTSWQDSR